MIEHPSFALATPHNEPYPLLQMQVDTECYPLIYKQHHVYLSFLQTCMEFFCQAIIAGIPLRGCVSTGLAIMNPYESTFLGIPLIEAARGEAAQKSIGIAFGKSFDNSHPVYNYLFIPHLAHIKDNVDIKGIIDANSYLSPMVLDWARYWRTYYSDVDFIECIHKMNTEPKASAYYDNAIKFFK